MSKDSNDSKGTTIDLESDHVEFKYTTKLLKGESVKLLLPNIKYNFKVLSYITFESQSNQFEAKIIGKDTIASFSEAIFYYTKSFDLSVQQHQITISEDVYLQLKNLASKDPLTITCTMLYRPAHERMLYNNTYSSFTRDVHSDIINEIFTSSKHITKIIFTSPNELTSIEFAPICDSTPSMYESYEYEPDDEDKHVIIIENPDPIFISELQQYKFITQDNLDKLGVTVYGL